MRNAVIDLLKGIAIITIILYHFGLLSSGYLGVEIFFVISGYLTTLSLLHEGNEINYFKFIKKRLIRLYPLAVLACLVSFAIGYYVMLPDYFKNTCETIAGTCMFSNNFVQHITSGNYWDQSNDYKPLMHTWYIGLLFQFYLLYPLIFLIVKRLFKVDFEKKFLSTLICLGIVSLGLYFYSESVSFKFYMLPCRLYEFFVGGIVAIVQYQRINYLKTAVLLHLMVLIGILYLLEIVSPNNLVVPAITVLTSYIIFKSKDCDSHILGESVIAEVFIKAGKASYSLYIWHQLIIAFWRYTINDYLSLSSYCIVLAVTIAVGWVSYVLFELKLFSIVSKKKAFENTYLMSFMLCAIVLTLASCKIYTRLGVVRNVPELNIWLNGQVLDSQSYNQRISSMYEGKSFERNGKPNILVIGDSFGRDWCNVLLESQSLSDYNLSYSSDCGEHLMDIVKEANVVFIANNGEATKYFDIIPYMVENNKVYRVGVKGFGRCMGKYYNASHDSAYYHQTINVPENIAAVNKKEKEIFGNSYIDIVALISTENGKLPIFTPDGKFFSHDGIHLTKAGAKRIAQLIDIKKMVNE